MIKGRREAKRGGGAHTHSSTDLLVCFPSLTLMPKPICSPLRLPSSSSSSSSSTDQPNKPRGHQHQRKRSIISRGGQGSPMLWTKTNKTMGSDILSSEPTSPKVTCAGQIKVRPKSSRSWQSVMEELEKKKRTLNWAETLGFKKEVMHFLTCLRTIRFDFRCFGSFSGATDDEEEEEEEEEDDEVYHENHVGVEDNNDEDEDEASRTTMFSKWFMVLQEEDQNKGMTENGKEEVGVSVPPPNALLLMRCRSAPGESWGLRESKEKAEEIKRGQSLRSLMMMDEDDEKKKENKLVVMRCHSDYYGISSDDDIATETWIVGDLRESMSRSRSWKR